MDDYPVKVGAMLFTLVDPNPGHEVAYNRWYERDHFYAGCMIGPGMLAGSRWVATRAHKDVRFPDDSEFATPVDAGSYLAIYWMARGQEAEWGDWASTQVWQLYKDGRGFAERTHAQTGLYDFASVAIAPDHPVSVELALDHRYGGLAVVVLEPAEGTSTDALINWVEAEAATQLFDAGDASMVSSWTLRRPADGDGKGEAPMPLGASGGSADRVVQLCFLEDEPLAHWEAYRDYAAKVDASGLGRCTFAAPLIPTIVGTDIYTGDLW